jgi:hypothetical protein
MYSELVVRNGAADMGQHFVQPTSSTHESHIQVQITCGGMAKVSG